MTVGKFVLVGLIYLFVVLVFRALLKDMSAAQPAAIAPATVRPPVPARSPTFRAATASATAAAPPVTAVSAPAAPTAAGPLAAGGTPSLVVESSPEDGLNVGMAFPLTAAVTIGRAGENAIVLPDRFSSSHHAIIFLQDGKRVLRDRGSTNGTMHNGHRLEGDVEVKAGDRIQIGTTVFRLSEGE